MKRLSVPEDRRHLAALVDHGTRVLFAPNFERALTELSRLGPSRPERLRVKSLASLMRKVDFVKDDRVFRLWLENDANVWQAQLALAAMNRLYLFLVRNSTADPLFAQVIANLNHDTSGSNCCAIGLNLMRRGDIRLAE